jgi:2-dehydropantoate 2-reductase
VADLALERWRKLVWNIPFNGIAVREQLDTAEILSRPALRHEIEEIMLEVIRAARRCGHDLPDRTISVQVQRTEEMEPYKPSTLIDYELGKPLELEAIWGEPLRRAERLGEDLPRMRKLYECLRTLSAAPAEV